ncbi:MAG: TonB-dependent receptor, partial [Armatimonadetes bacterium]|nr:TonB-dependent receptor [Armatimonadota bacterium]
DVYKRQSTTSPNSESVLQFYYDRTKRDDIQHYETRATYDIDFQHRRAIGSNQELMYGVGYRASQDNIRRGYCFTWTPDRRHDRLYSAFVQEDIHLRQKRDRLTLGAKLEHNDYTGWELQPNIRYFRSLDRRSSLWAAVSRAARTPSRSERTGQFDYKSLPGVGGVANVVRVYGNPEFVSEKLTAYELGYRVQPNDKLALDIAAFCNVYDDLRTLEQDVAPFVRLTPVPHVIVPFTLRNNMKGTTYGLEVAGDWRVSKRWRIAFGYGNLVMRLKRDRSGVVFLDEKLDSDSPRQQFKLRSYLDLSNNLEFDTIIYAVDRPSSDAPGYVRLDLRLGWAASDNLEVSMGVQNLLQKHHVEFGRSLGESPTEVPRSFYTKLIWQL